MKIIDKGKILDKLCEYLNSHKKETGIVTIRKDNTTAYLKKNRLFTATLGRVSSDINWEGEKELSFTIDKSVIDNENKINFDEFKNLLKTFEIKNKININIEMD